LILDSFAILALLEGEPAATVVRRLAALDCEHRVGPAREAARASGSALVTADPHLLDLCPEEGILVGVLPDSSGRTWSAP
jgi:hypothetical protein